MFDFLAGLGPIGQKNEYVDAKAVAIVGGTGNIGSNVIQQLCHRQDIHTLRVVSRKGMAFSTSKINALHRHKIQIIDGNFCLEDSSVISRSSKALLMSAFKDINTVVMILPQCLTSDSMLRIGKSVVLAATESKVDTIIYLSSFECEIEKKKEKEQKTEMLSAYACARFEIEGYALSLGINMVVVRPTLLFSTFVTISTKEMITTRHPIIFKFPLPPPLGPVEDNKINFISEKDVARVISTVVGSKPWNKYGNVIYIHGGSANSMTVGNT